MAGKTTATPKIAGDLAANLTLTGLGVTGTVKATLATATIKGSVPGATWNLTGPVGAITINGAVGEAAASWQLAGPLTVGTLTLGDVTNAEVTAAGGLGAVKAIRWLDGAIQATKAASIATTGLKTAKPPVAGDFAADLTLTGVGLTSKDKTLGSAAIAGRVGAATWDLTGVVGTLTIAGTVGTVAQPWHLSHPTSLDGLTLGDVTSAVVTVTSDTGAVKAVRSLDGSITAAKIASITTTGIAGTKTVAAVLGDFAADVTVTGGGLKQVLGTLTVAGWLDGAVIGSAGPIGTVTVGGMHDSRLTAGDMTTACTSIAGLAVKGLKGEPLAFINSNVSAWALGMIGLKCVQPNNTGHTPAAFGIKGHTVTGYTRDGKKYPSKGLPGLVIDHAGDYSVELV